MDLQPVESTQIGAEDGLRQPKQRRSHRSLERLLQSAETLIAEGGVDRLTLAALLRDSGLSNGAFYARFPSLEALVEEVQHRALLRLESEVAAQCKRLGEERPGLDAALERVMDALFHQFDTQGALFDALLRVTAKRQTLQRRAARTHARVEKAVTAALAPYLAELGRRAVVKRIATAHSILAGALKAEAEFARLGPLSGMRPGRLDRREMFLALRGYLRNGGEARAPEPKPPQPAASPEAESRRVSAFSQRKIEKILEAAREHFLRDGFGATTMDQVAAAAGVGKATVYAHFPSKAQLFAAVVSGESRTPIAEIETATGDDVASILQRFARQAFRLILSPDNTSRIRMVAAEAQRFPELGDLFYAAGPARLNASLANYLGRAMQRGELRTAEPDLAAVHFLTLICGDLRVRALIGAPTRLDDAAADRVVAGGLDAFLRAYRRD